MPNVPFGTEARQPIIPLSLENLDLARAREFIIDYRNNKAYVKNKNGDLIDFANSSTVLQYLETYIEQRPTVILDCLIIERDGQKYSIRQSFIDIYNRMVALDNKEYYYAASDSDGGTALVTKKLTNSLRFMDDGNTVFTFDGSGSRPATFDINDDLKLFSASEGGEITGEVEVAKTITLANGVSFGTSFPSRPVEGQIFIRLTENVG